MARKIKGTKSRTKDHPTYPWNLAYGKGGISNGGEVGRGREAETQELYAFTKPFNKYGGFGCFEREINTKITDRNHGKTFFACVRARVCAVLSEKGENFLYMKTDIKVSHSAGRDGARRNGLRGRYREWGN